MMTPMIPFTPLERGEGEERGRRGVVCQAVWPPIFIALHGKFNAMVWIPNGFPPVTRRYVVWGVWIGD